MPSNAISSGLRLALAASAMTLLAACATSGNAVRRELPPLPSYVQRVETPDPKSGEPALLVAARERAAKAHANCIIESTANWYGRVRAAYAEELSSDDIDREVAAACSGSAKK